MNCLKKLWKSKNTIPEELPINHSLNKLQNRPTPYYINMDENYKPKTHTVIGFKGDAGFNDIFNPSNFSKEL